MPVYLYELPTTMRSKRTKLFKFSWKCLKTLTAGSLLAKDQQILQLLMMQMMVCRYTFKSVLTCIISAVAVVGFEKMFYQFVEEAPQTQVCMRVYSPSGDCPIDFDFKVRLSTTDGSAGQWIYTLYYTHAFATAPYSQSLPVIMYLCQRM